MSLMGRRMAFYPKVWYKGRFSITLREAEWYANHTDGAFDLTQVAIEIGGAVPVTPVCIDYVIGVLGRNFFD